MKPIYTTFCLVFLFLYQTSLFSQAVELSFSPLSDTVYAGETATFHLDITPSGGFNQQVFFELVATSMSLSEFTYSFSPTSIFPPYTSGADLNLNISGGVIPGDHWVTIKAGNGPVEDIDTCYLHVYPEICNFFERSTPPEAYAVNRMSFDSTGRLWGVSSVGTSSSTLIRRYNGSTWQIVPLPVSGKILNSIAFDSNNHAWIPINNGLVEFVDDTVKAFYNIMNSFLPSQYVDEVVVDGNDDLWLATRKGLARFDGAFWTVWNTANSALPDNRIKEVEVDANGDVWAIVDGLHGLAKCDGSTIEIMSSSASTCTPPMVNPHDLASDSEGNLWVSATVPSWSTYPPQMLIKYSVTNWEVWETEGSYVKYDAMCNVLSSNPSGSELIAGTRFWAYIDNEDVKWISEQGISSSGGRLTRLDDIGWNFYDDSNTAIPHNSFTAIAQHPTTGNIWVATGENPYSPGNTAIVSEFICHQHTYDVLLTNVEGPKVASRLEIYPNPAHQLFRVDLPQGATQNSTLSVFDLAGRTLFEKRMQSEKSLEIDVSEWTNGIYLIKYTMENGETGWGKLIKE